MKRSTTMFMPFLESREEFDHLERGVTAPVFNHGEGWGDCRMSAGRFADTRGINAHHITNAADRSAAIINNLECMRQDGALGRGARIARNMEEAGI